MSTGMRTHWCGEVRADDAGRQVALCGWVDARREHGEHLAFLDVRDRSGVIQCVVEGGLELRAEWVVRVSGTVRARPEGTVNPDLATGEVEVGDAEVEVLARAEPPPFPVSDRVEADESLRLAHRYVDLRRPRMQRNLGLRATVTRALRAAMERQGFLEVETPLLWTPTPEGAREFVIPSRLQPGSFYVLPQSPQLAKQLLMVGGVERYYQMARCLRDEDLRSDRQFEFTQLDVEASFVGQDDVLAFVSEAVLDAVEAVAGARPPAIERMAWSEAMDRFGTDKPDLRAGPELVELGPMFASTGFRAFAGAPSIKGVRVPHQGGLGRSRLDGLEARARDLGAKGLVWLRVGEGGELDSPVARFLSDDERRGVLAVTAAGPGDLVLVVADEEPTARAVLGQLRLELGRPPVGQGPPRLLWVVDFPMFEGLDPDGRPVPAHHPFTMPNPEDLDRLESDPLAVRSQAYDLVQDGWELGSGSIRIHRPDIQSRVFAALGLDEAQARARFGFLLDAFGYGAPPHGGFALGLDRLVALLAGEENIREVIAFPKTQSGTDPLTGAPGPLAPEVLGALGLRPAKPRPESP